VRLLPELRGLGRLGHTADHPWFNMALKAYVLYTDFESPTVITAASDTDTALDDLTRNTDYDIDISGTLHWLANILRDSDIQEQILLSRPVTITPGSTAAPVRKYRCREWDANNSVWMGWTEWTAI